MNDVIKEFESQFHSEAHELLILPKAPVRGAQVLGDFLAPSITFIASSDCHTGELNQRIGRLEWLTPRQKDGSSYGYEFDAFTVYRVRANKRIEATITENMRPEMANCYRLLDVLESGATHPELEAVARKYKALVVVNDLELGAFELDRELSWFRGQLDWQGRACAVFMPVEEGSEDIPAASLATLRELHARRGHWDRELRIFAAAKLTDLANQWQQEDDDSAPPITTESFAARMSIQDIDINTKGAITAYFDDGDLFFGHVICVAATLADGPSDAHIAG